jgi:hypothetical protein
MLTHTSATFAIWAFLAGGAAERPLTPAEAGHPC